MSGDHSPTIPLTQAERDAFAVTVAWLRHPSQSWSDAFEPLADDGVEWVGSRQRFSRCPDCGHIGLVDTVTAGECCRGQMSGFRYVWGYLFGPLIARLSGWWVRFRAWWSR